MVYEMSVLAQCVLSDVYQLNETMRQQYLLITRSGTARSLWTTRPADFNRTQQAAENQLSGLFVLMANL